MVKPGTGDSPVHKVPKWPRWCFRTPEIGDLGPYSRSRFASSLHL